MDMTDQIFVKISGENAKTDLAEVCAEIRAGERSMTAAQRKTVEPQGGLNNADRPDGSGTSTGGPVSLAVDKCAVKEHPR